MTVNELIEELKKYPGDMRVLTPGHEAGYHDIRLFEGDIIFDVRSEDLDSWYGPHEDFQFTDEKAGIPCLIVRRKYK